MNTFHDREGATWSPDFITDTPGQRLAAEAIRNWISVSGQMDDVEGLASDYEAEETLEESAAFPPEISLEGLGDVSDLSDKQRECAGYIVARFREYPGFLLDRHDFSDIALDGRALGELHRSHFLKIIKALTVEPDSQDLGVVKVPMNLRPAYWLREVTPGTQPTMTLASARIRESERYAWRVRALEDVVNLMQEHAGFWFTAKDLHPYFFDENVSLSTQDGRIKRALELIANHPKYGPHFREDRIKSGKLRRFWYAEDPTDFEQPYAAFADMDAPEREFDPNQKVVRRRVESSQNKPEPKVVPVATPEIQTVSWHVLFNEDGSGSVGSSETKDALVLHIVDIVTKSTDGVAIDTVLARLQEQGLNPDEHRLRGALKYIQAWLPKNYAERWYDESSEDRNGKPIRRLRIDRTRRK